MEIPRDQYLDTMTFRSAPRPIFVELFGPLVGLEAEWRAQGATPRELSLEAFDFDYVRRFSPCVTTGLLGWAEERVIEETAEHVIRLDGYGRRTRLVKFAATVGLPMDYPVTDMDSWRRFRPRYLFAEERFAPGWAEEARRARAEGALIVARIPGGFDEPRQLMGDEAACVACYEQPDLLHDMLDVICETAVRVLDRVSREVTVDVLSIHEDLAGKSGALVGPRQIREFIRPYYRRVWDMLRSRGARLCQQDSDGNLTGVLEAFVEAGVNCSLPMEPAAGMDIVRVRETFGTRLAVMGGIDKHVLRRSRQEIVAELEYKLQPKMRQGGTVFGLDHRIPNGTPLENYRFYVRKAREILGLPPAEAGKGGWARMAF
jgi:hypothetical protein